MDEKLFKKESILVTFTVGMAQVLLLKVTIFCCYGRCLFPSAVSLFTTLALSECLFSVTLVFTQRINSPVIMCPSLTFSYSLFVFSN